MERFIKKIHIDKLHHLENIDIVLSSYERRHLLLIGKNGSGKTSLLETLSDCLQAVIVDMVENPKQTSETDYVRNLRMEKNWLLKGTLSEYNFEGLVLIDELKTHLHIKLQRKILPFLTTFFPRVQFVISTHSPYILTSVSNVTIFDLEKKVTFDDMSNYSIDDVAEAYFNSEDYSIELEKKLAKYKSLLEKNNPSDEERIRRAKLRSKLKSINDVLSSRIKDALDKMFHNKCYIFEIKPITDPQV